MQSEVDNNNNSSGGFSAKRPRLSSPQSRKKVHVSENDLTLIQEQVGSALQLRAENFQYDASSSAPYYKMIAKLNSGKHVRELVLACSANFGKFDFVAHKELIKEIFRLPWPLTDDAKLVVAYVELIVNFASKHDACLGDCFRNVRYFFPTESGSTQVYDKYNWKLSEISSSRVHEFFQRLIKVVPQATKMLFSSIQKQFPHVNRHDAEIHRFYLQNLLVVSSYCPSLRARLFDVCVDRILQVDLLIRVDDIPDEDAQSFLAQTTAPAEILDVMMEQMFQYLDECVDQQATHEIFSLLIRVFERKILKAHNSKFVQFLMFYVCRVKVGYAEQFLNFLMTKLMGAEYADVTRRYCAGYIGSFVCRANYLPVLAVRRTLTILSDWAVAYSDKRSNLTPNVTDHGLFYLIVQSILYVICFHRNALESFEHQFVSMSKSPNRNRSPTSFFVNLRLEELSRSSLNPLKFCLPTIVREFGGLAFDAGLVSICKVIKSNRKLVVDSNVNGSLRNKLEPFFPFDPYLLRRSSSRFDGLYREWGSNSSSLAELAESHLPTKEVFSEVENDSPVSKRRKPEEKSTSKRVKATENNGTSSGNAQQEESEDGESDNEESDNPSENESDEDGGSDSDDDEDDEDEDEDENEDANENNDRQVPENGELKRSGSVKFSQWQDQDEVDDDDADDEDNEETYNSPLARTLPFGNDSDSETENSSRWSYFKK